MKSSSETWEGVVQLGQRTAPPGLKENGQEVLSNLMANPQFRVVEKQKHARDIARQAVKHWREEELPICNQFHSGANHLDVDAIVKRTERTIMETPRPRYKLNPVVIAFLLFWSVMGLAWLFVEISF